MVLQSIEELSKFYCTGGAFTWTIAKNLAQQSSAGVLPHASRESVIKLEVCNRAIGRLSEALAPWRVATHNAPLVKYQLASHAIQSIIQPPLTSGLMLL